MIDDANEDQVLLAVEDYMGRVGLLKQTLQNVCQIYRYGEHVQSHRALTFVLDAMDRHLGSHYFFFFLKYSKEFLETFMKNKLYFFR